MNTKRVSIPTALFIKLIEYFVFDEKDATRAEAIKKELLEKLNAMERRDIYTQSKTADTPEERETARLKYLDLAGISQDFRK